MNYVIDKIMAMTADPMIVMAIPYSPRCIATSPRAHVALLHAAG